MVKKCKVNSKWGRKDSLTSKRSEQSPAAEYLSNEEWKKEQLHSIVLKQ